MSVEDEEILPTERPPGTLELVSTHRAEYLLTFTETGEVEMLRRPFARGGYSRKRAGEGRAVLLSAVRYRPGLRLEFVFADSSIPTAGYIAGAPGQRPGVKLPGSVLTRSVVLEARPVVVPDDVSAFMRF